MILQQLVAFYLIGVALAVAAYFVVNPFHAESFNPENVWRVLNILMAVGLVVALAYNFRRKMIENRNLTGDSITRPIFGRMTTLPSTFTVSGPLSARKPCSCLRRLRRGKPIRRPGRWPAFNLRRYSPQPPAA